MLAETSHQIAKQSPTISNTLHKVNNEGKCGMVKEKNDPD